VVALLVVFGPPSIAHPFLQSPEPRGRLEPGADLAIRGPGVLVGPAIILTTLCWRSVPRDRVLRPSELAPFGFIAHDAASLLADLVFLPD
jgi:hypothetical protein